MGWATGRICSSRRAGRRVRVSRADCRQHCARSPAVWLGPGRDACTPSSFLSAQVPRRWQNGAQMQADKNLRVAQSSLGSVLMKSLFQGSQVWSKGLHPELGHPVLRAEKGAHHSLVFPVLAHLVPETPVNSVKSGGSLPLRTHHLRGLITVWCPAVKERTRRRRVQCLATLPALRHPCSSIQMLFISQTRSARVAFCLFQSSREPGVWESEGRAF